MMKLALFGQMRAGKDTVAELLITKHEFTPFRFGSGIGEIIDTYLPDAWKFGKPRYHFQYIGQMMRRLDKDVWINYTLNQVETTGAEKVVITDGRQLNEVKRLREEGYFIVKVVASEAVRIERIKAAGDAYDPSALKHETELQAAQIEADFEITNEGTLEELAEQIEIMLQVAKERLHDE